MAIGSFGHLSPGAVTICAHENVRWTNNTTIRVKLESSSGPSQDDFSRFVSSDGGQATVAFPAVGLVAYRQTSPSFAQGTRAKIIVQAP